NVCPGDRSGSRICRGPRRLRRLQFVSISLLGSNPREFGEGRFSKPQGSTVGAETCGSTRVAWSSALNAAKLFRRGEGISGRNSPRSRPLRGPLFLRTQLFGARKVQRSNPIVRICGQRAPRRLSGALLPSDGLQWASTES